MKPEKCQGSKRRAPAPLFLSFLLVLLIVPSAAFAANIWPPPRDTNGIETWNNTLTITPGCCEIMNYVSCVDANTESISTANQIVQFQGTDGSGNPIYAIYNWSTTATKPCQNGCSETLGACRPGPFIEFLVFVLLFAALGYMIYIAPNLGSVGLYLGLVIFLGSIWIALWDVFSPALTLMVRSMPLLLMFLLIARVLGWRAGEKEKEEAEGMPE